MSHPQTKPAHDCLLALYPADDDAITWQRDVVAVKALAKEQ